MIWIPIGIFCLGVIALVAIPNVMPEGEDVEDIQDRLREEREGY